MQVYFFTALRKFSIQVTFVATWMMQKVNQVTVLSVFIDDDDVDDDLCAVLLQL